MKDKVNYIKLTVKLSKALLVRYLISESTLNYSKIFSVVNFVLLTNWTLIKLMFNSYFFKFVLFSFVL